MRSLFKDLIAKGFIYGIGSSLNGLFGFLLIPFFVGRLHAAEYGRYALAEMLLNLLSVILGMGLNVAILSYYSKLASNEHKYFIGSVLSLVLASTVVIDCIYLTCMLAFGQHLFPSLTNNIFFLIVYISFIENVWLFFGTVFRAQGSAWSYICASFIQVLVGLVATVWLIVMNGYREEGILYGRLIGDIVLLLFLLPQFIKYRLHFDKIVTVRLLKIGLPLVPVTFASMWVIMSPRFFIEKFGSPTDVGVFTMSTKIAGLISIGFVQPFAMAWMVSMFKIYRRTDARNIYAKVFTYFILIGGSLALVLAVISPQIAILLGKNKFPLSSNVIAIMALSNLASGLMYPLNVGPYVKDSTYKVIPVYTFTSVVSLLFVWAMTYFYGVNGACLALLATYLLQALLLNRLSNSIFYIKKEWSRITKASVAMLISYLFALYFPDITQWNGIQWFAPLVYFIVLVVLLFIFRFFDDQEIRLLTAWYRRESTVV